MTFSKNGALYKIAYGWPTGSDFKKEEELESPDQSDLCSFFWKVILSVILVWPFIGLTLVFGWIVRIVGSPFAFIFFGCKPAGPSWRLLTSANVDDNFFPFVKIEWWPKILEPPLALTPSG